MTLAAMAAMNGGTMQEHTEKEQTEWAFWHILAPLRPTARQMTQLLAVADAYRVAAVIAHTAELTRSPRGRSVNRARQADQVSQVLRQLRHTGTATAGPL
jgi:hypothetical protein